MEDRYLFKAKRLDWREFPEKDRNYRKDLGYWINMVNAEVVGNIFDNPELLESEG